MLLGSGGEVSSIASPGSVNYRETPPVPNLGDQLALPEVRPTSACRRLGPGTG